MAGMAGHATDSIGSGGFVGVCLLILGLGVTLWSLGRVPTVQVALVFSMLGFCLVSLAYQEYQQRSQADASSDI